MKPCLEAVRPINALVPVKLYTRMRQAAARQEKSLSEIIRAALLAYLDREIVEKEGRGAAHA